MNYWVCISNAVRIETKATPEAIFATFPCGE